MIRKIGVGLLLAGIVATSCDKSSDNTSIDDAVNNPGISAPLSPGGGSIGGGFGDGGIGSGGTGDGGPHPPRINQFANSMDDINEAVRYLDDNDLEAINVPRYGSPQSVNELTPDILSSLTVARSDSPLMQQFYSQAPGFADFIKDNVEYVVFSPGLVHHLGSSKGDVGGLSFGNGIIGVDTRADDGMKKNPITFGSIIAHEAQHEFDRNNSQRNMGTLVFERRAFERESSFLEEQLTLDPDNANMIQALLDICRDRITTAEFLGQFGNDFSGVYPHGTLLAKHLLEAGMSANVLSRYTVERSFRDRHDEQLYYAARYAHIATTQPREDAIRTLHGIVTAPENAGTLKQVSAASALQFLAPRALEDHTSGGVGYNDGATISFGSPTSRSGMGGFTGRSSSYGVSGLPSLQEMLDNERYPDGIPDVVARYRLHDGVDRVCNTTENGVPLLLIPDREGKPSEEFFRCYIEAGDRDGNGRNDVMVVFYVTNEVQDRRGCCLAKKDIYNGRGEYIGSGLNWVTFGHRGSDIPFDPVQQAREWNLERR